MMAAFWLLLATSLSVLSAGVLQILSDRWRRHAARVQRDAQHTLQAAFLFLDVARLQPTLWIAGALATGLVAWLFASAWVVVPVGGVLLVGPPMLLARLRHRRAQRFDAQLPDLVQALAAALRAGSSLHSALVPLVREAPAPLGQELALLLREQRLGLDLATALANLHARMPTESCALVVSALSLAARTGGGLAETLERLAQTLRLRQHWLGRVRALTAQGRMQSLVMAALPLLLLAVLSGLEPEAMEKLWRTPPGWLVLLAIGALETVGLLWIRRLVDIDV